MAGSGCAGTHPTCAAHVAVRCHWALLSVVWQHLCGSHSPGTRVGTALRQTLLAPLVGVSELERHDGSFGVQDGLLQLCWAHCRLFACIPFACLSFMCVSTDAEQQVLSSPQCVLSRLHVCRNSWTLLQCPHI